MFLFCVPLQIPENIGGDALHDLVPFVQFKKREKHPWRNVTFSEVIRFTFYTPPWAF